MESSSSLEIDSMPFLKFEKKESCFKTALEKQILFHLSNFKIFSNRKKR